MAQTSIQLGPIGIWSFQLETCPAAKAQEIASELEQLGFGALWFGEAAGREAFTHAGLLLAGTKRIVIATGIAHSVRDCVEIAFDQAGVEIDGHVVIDESLKRPAEVDHLIGDTSKARHDLGWEPRTSFEQLIRLMVDADYELLSR